MYMVMFSTCASSIFFIIGKRLDYRYGLWLSTFIIIANSILTSFIAKKVKESGRQSILVILLSIVLGIITVTVPIVGAFTLTGEQDAGIDIWQGNEFC